MNNIISYDAFEGTIQIDVSREEIQEIVIFHITEVQEKILRKLLGDNFYFELESNFENYTEFISGGINYSLNGVNYKYTGIEKMLAYFTYFYYSRSEVSSNTPMGETQSKSKDGDSVINDHKLINAWNQGLKLYYEAVNYLTYKGYDFDYEQIDKMNHFGI